MKNGSCHQPQPSCHTHKQRFDYLLWGTLIIIAPAYLAAFFAPEAVGTLAHFSHSVFAIMNQVWWGIVLGIVFVGLIGLIPREFVIAMLGPGDTVRGIMRATAAGLLFDLCSHGILLVGMKLYERGASLGQVMAFLIASPWNSISLTLILWALVGLKVTLIFIVFSALIAVTSGIIFNLLVEKAVLPGNPNKIDIPEDFHFMPELKARLRHTSFGPHLLKEIAWGGFKESRMILRWLLLGVILAAALRAFMPAEFFASIFGPTFMGLLATLFTATILEICSEGSTPIAAEIVTRAHAPGNGFAFLMAGVSTDYTEIMALKETMRSWKIALFLPLVTLPQIALLGWLLNQ